MLQPESPRAMVVANFPSSPSSLLVWKPPLKAPSERSSYQDQGMEENGPQVGDS